MDRPTSNAARRPPIPRIVRAIVCAAACLGFIAALLPAPPASAHGRSVSYSSWELDAEGAEVQVRLKLLELSRLGPEALPPGTLPGHRPPTSPDLTARVFPGEIILWADGEPCRAPASAQRQPDEPGWVQYRWRVECPGDAASLLIRSHLLLDVAPSHMHFARVRMGAAPTESAVHGVREQVLTEASPEFVLRRPGDAPPGDASGDEIGSELVDYIVLGVEHILTGWDHLAFVCGLLLLASRLGEVARLITGFTLAHSLTLALVALDMLHPHASAVEAVIAFSVALVAIEKGWLLSGRPRSIPILMICGLGLIGLAGVFGLSTLPVLTVAGLALFTACYFTLVARNENAWLRICLTFAFGLVHGFGFAGVLVEMTLPSERLLPALLGFNVGVEIGQIGIVLILWPLMMLGQRVAGLSMRIRASEIATATLCGIGLYWLVERAFSL